MKSRLEAITLIAEAMKRAGFYLAEDKFVANPIFDIVARRDNTLLLIKVLTNIDSMDRGRAAVLKNISSALGAIPLIIGNRSCSKPLDDGVVYLRYGISLITPASMIEYVLEDEAPMVFSGHGGYYARIDSEKLHEARVRNNISLSYLAGKVGVSVRTIQMYENGMCPSIDIAIDLEDLLGEPIVEPIDPFKQVDTDNQEDTVDDAILWGDQFSDMHRAIYAMLSSIGYNVVPVSKCPFDAVGKDYTNDMRLVGGIRYAEEGRSELKRSARVISTISHITEANGVIFISRHVKSIPLNMEGMPIIGMDEISDELSGEDILEMIFSRSDE